MGYGVGMKPYPPYELLKLNTAGNWDAWAGELVNWCEKATCKMYKLEKALQTADAKIKEMLDAN